MVDNLPAAIPRMFQDAQGETSIIYETGFPLGEKSESTEKDKETYYINNHVNIKLLFHVNPDAYVGRRIVGFEVEPER